MDKDGLTARAERVTDLPPAVRPRLPCHSSKVGPGHKNQLRNNPGQSKNNWRPPKLAFCVTERWQKSWWHRCFVLPQRSNTSFSALPWAEPFLSPALSICRMIPGLGHGPSATQEPHKKQRAEAWDGVYPSANHKQQLFLLEWPKNLKRRKGPHFVLAPLMLSWWISQD